MSPIKLLFFLAGELGENGSNIDLSFSSNRRGRGFCAGSCWCRWLALCGGGGLCRLCFSVTKNLRHDVSEDTHNLILLSVKPSQTIRVDLLKSFDHTHLNQSCRVRNVSQLATSPDFKPVMNQRVRCSEVP
jgi:hypothetical protein